MTTMNGLVKRPGEWACIIYPTPRGASVPGAGSPRSEERRSQARRHGGSLTHVEDLTAPLADRPLRLTSALLKALDVRG